MRQIVFITVVVLIATACSVWVEPDPQLGTPNSYSTRTPTSTVPSPFVGGVHFEETTVPNLPPKATALPWFDLVPDPKLDPWFQVPDLPWFPVIVP